MSTTLVINPGSSLRRYALFDDGLLALEISLEETSSGFDMCSKFAGVQQVCQTLSGNDFFSSFNEVVEAVDGYLLRKSAGKKLDTIAIKVVSPGTFFQRHAEIDDLYIDKLKFRTKTSPLQIPVILKEIEAVQKKYSNIKLVAASDSAFHSDMPPKAREYSIPSEDASNFDIHRFGYHGLSVASVVRRIHSLIGQDPERMIVCHVGSSASVTAVRNGKSVETTAGFSPATGLPMGSRAGDLDTAALLELVRVKNAQCRDIDMYVNTRGGLAGIAGETDIRRLLERRSRNDAAATHALNVFAYNIQKEVAGQTVALGGLDVLVLTATAAARSSDLRSIIMQGLSHLGIQINKDRNDLLVGKDGVISVRNSAVKVVVMRTDEVGEIAQIANQFSNSKK